MTFYLVIDISNADHGHKAEECLRVLKEVILNKKTPNSIDFNLSEVLMLTCWGDYGPYNENIAIAFSLTFLLKGDYQAQIGEDSNVYWLIYLFVVTSCFDREHKEALLSFYLWYIQNEFTYDNPFIFLYYLIIATMVSLNYPVETIKPMLEYLQQTDYTKTSFVYTYFPENKFAIVSEKLNDAIQEYNTEESFKSEFLNIWHEIVTSYQAEKLNKKDTD